jgi:S-DNA-T family DNA segregation ATPase FtsK/SpoIIIE
MGKLDKNGVDIRYRKPPLERRQTNINAMGSRNTSENIKNDLEKHYARNIKALSIIFIVLSILVLISIITYSPKDEFVLGWGLRDFWGLFKGDENIIQRTQEVSNLMGTIGALVANFFVNKTIGYFSVLLPFLVIIWGIKLFLTQRVTSSLIWLSIIILSFGILLSSFVGGLESLTNIGIPYYFYGLFGAFISQFASYLLGKVGSIIFFVFALLITTIIAFDLRVEKCFDFFVRVLK